MRGFRHHLRFLGSAALLLLACMTALVHAAGTPGDFAARIRGDVEWITSFGSRVPGTEGHRLANQSFLERVHAVEGIKVWAEEFPVVVPVYQEGVLEMEGGGRHAVHPLWPCSARLNTTPIDGVEGRLVYVGEGTPREIPPGSIRGAIAVMEMTGGRNWVTVASYAPSAILLLGSDRETMFHAHEHVLYMPVHMPRAYIAPGPLADRLRSDGGRGRLTIGGVWQTVTARNVYALATPAAGTAPQKAFVIGVVADAMSMVPGDCPGADAAVDVGLALELLQEFAIEPPSRPVLFTFIDAWGIYHLGTREMFATLAVPPEAKAGFLDELVARQSLYEEQWSRADALEARGDQALEELHLEVNRDLLSCIRDAAYTRITRLDVELEPLRVESFLAEGDEKAAIEERIRELSGMRGRLLATLRQVSSPSLLAAENRPLAAELWDEARIRLREQAAEVRSAVGREQAKARIREEVIAALGLPPATACPLGFFLGIDVSDAGHAVGPSFTDAMLRANEITTTIEVRDWLRGIEEREAATIWTPAERLAVNLRPITTAEDFDSYILGPQTNISAPAMSFGVPALTWTTLSGYRTKVDTSRDHPANLDWSILEPQLAATRSLVMRFCRSGDFHDPEPRQLARWRRITGTIVDQAPGDPLPRLPMRGYLTTMMVGDAGLGKANAHHWWGDVAGMRRQQFVFSNTDGRFAIDYFPGHIFSAMALHHVQSYDFAPDGSIVRAVDLMQSGKGVNLNHDVMARAPAPLRAQVFTCRELNLFGLLDPRFLMPLPLGSLVDTGREGTPTRLNQTFHRSVLSAQLDPRIMASFIGQTGIDNRLLLLNMADSGEDLSIRESTRGFATGSVLPRQTWHQSAVDFHRLNTLRLEGYRKAGIVSRPIDELRATSGRLLEEAEAAIDADDGGRFFQATSAVLANEVRAYRAVRDTANDVVRAAVFLLLMLVPFAYAMERLLVASAHVYRQLAWSSGIFLLMAAILWAFHPAFRISAQPLTIILAFVIILMSLMVMSMVFSRFERELQELRGGRAEASGATSSQLGLLATALPLGIANMRKRKVRTALTGVTVVLITFTLLCFSSVSSYQSQKDNQLETLSSYTGVLVRQPSSRAIQRESVDYIESVLGPEHPIAIRAWRFSPWSAQWRIHITNSRNGRDAALPAALALSPNEGRFTAVRDVLPRWEEFDDRSTCYLSKQTAGDLGVVPGDEVIVLGRSLRLLGTYDGETIGDLLLDMDGESLAPLDFHAVGDQQRQKLASGDWSMEVLANEIQSGEGLEPLRRVPRLHGDSFAIVPIHMIDGGLGNETFSIRSIAVAAADRDDARAVAMQLVDRLAFPIYYGTPSGVNVVASTPFVPRPPKSLLVPILIAGLIIFNTMLSSISERRQEIYTYTSLGLAPGHIARLFLAEALTYGLMGSVFGYVVGQWAASGLSALGLLGGITLNYSGTQAISTMLVVMLVITVSSLVPAFMAGRLAAPSNRMSWDVPEPVGDTIRDTLPFTATSTTAPGLLAFLDEFVRAHCSGVIGCFTAESVECRLQQDAGGRGVYLLRGSVWLAPYDLGVHQDFVLAIAPTDDGGIHEVRIELVRGTGQSASWRRLNRVFLQDLRKQLLGWRNLDAGRMIRYIEQGRAVLGL